MRVPAADRIILRQQMPRGYRAKAVALMLAKGKSLSPQAVSQWFSDKYHNEDLGEVLLTIATQNKASVREMSRRIRTTAKR